MDRTTRYFKLYVTKPLKSKHKLALKHEIRVVAAHKQLNKECSFSPANYVLCKKLKKLIIPRDCTTVKSVTILLKENLKIFLMS